MEVVVPSVKPVRSHAAGPPTCDSNAGGQHKKVEELEVIIREERSVEKEDATHFSVILLLYSITEMRWKRDSMRAQQMRESSSTCGMEVEMLGEV